MADSKVGACRHFTYLQTYIYKKSGLALKEHFPSNLFISFFIDSVSRRAVTASKRKIPVFYISDIARSREVPNNNRHRV